MMTHRYFPHRRAASRLALLAGAAWLGLSLTAAPARAAECYADYKAKQESPLKLHYGVMALRGACSKESATQEVAARLGQNGWTLLTILSVFDAADLEKRKANAGPYYLRF